MTNPTIPNDTKEQDMSEELKPCPHCWHTPVLDRWSDGRDSDGNEHQMGEVVCTNCGCMGPSAFISQAIAAWNQRAKPVVKALHWEQEPDMPHLWDADGMGILYRVIELHDGTASLRIGNMNREHSAHENVEAAFSFANNHNTRRVHACLEGYDHVED